MQLPLNIRLGDTYCFENFLGNQNVEAKTALETAIDSLAQPIRQFSGVFYLWGLTGTGKTHLLQSACRRARLLGMDSAYLPLTDPGIQDPEILQGLDRLKLVCIDDLQFVAGQKEWEVQLFNLYERLQGRGLLAITSAFSPAVTGIQLPDLVSRFNKGLAYGLHSLGHMERLEIVRQRAKLRGFDLSEDVAGYIEKHLPRDLASLLRLLDQLDQASLIHQRKITVPFVKAILENDKAS